MAQRKRYVLAGTGSRGLHMFGKPLLEQFTEFCELAALFDPNPKRLEAANGILGTHLPGFTDFQELLRKVRPEAVIVASRDDTHAPLIVQALEAGCRAISEKPLCVNGRQIREVLAAQRRHRRKGGRCLVTHNLRYVPPLKRIRELLREGAIGDLRVVNFHENLDRRHGADYFRRWHRQKAHSGGLLIHKASHHFDYLNWLVGSRPAELVAQGGLVFYGKHGPFRHRRCLGCPHATSCDFYADLFAKPEARRLYREAESEDGYLRDGCVFDRVVDIEDQAVVSYRYQNGVQVAYSLCAFASYEGMQIQLEGTAGRIEYKSIHSTAWAAGKATVHGLEELQREEFRLFNSREGVRTLTYARAEGSHGGSDPQLRQDFFGRPFDAPLTPLQAPLEEAAQAVLIGHAANVSLARGSRPVQVQDFLKRG